MTDRDSELLPFTRYGPLEVPGGADLISRFLTEFGEWSYFETEFLSRLVPPQARILDAGAFVGTFALSLRCCQPLGVVSIEANPRLLPLLKKNFARLAPDTFMVEHGVLGDGVAPQSPPKLELAENLGSLSFVAERGVSLEAEWDEMPAAVTLPQLRALHGNFDFIKLDLEGGELNALRADVDWLRVACPTLWVECNEQEGVFALYEFIRGLGYDVHYMAYPSYNPNNFLRNPKPIFAVAHEAGMIATQPGRPPILDSNLATAGCDLIKIQDAEHLRACLWVTPRWGLAEWAELPRSRLLALVSRLYRQQQFETFIGRN